MANAPNADDANRTPDNVFPTLSLESSSASQPVPTSGLPEETYSFTGAKADEEAETDRKDAHVSRTGKVISDNSVKPGKRPAKNSLWILIGCNVLVFMSSVCVMVLELTASRLIAKHVGSSLYTWTSVIGVVLAGITIGNFIGGWLADKAPPSKLLNWLFLTSSILCLSVLWLDEVATNQERPAGWGWPAWVLCVVGMVFFLPSLSLGTISPVVASLALSQSRKVGATVGNVYAWGAFGSIVGTFLGGFILIDTMGTRAIVALVAGTLAAMGACSAGTQWAFRSAVVFGWMQLVTWVGLSASVTDVGMKGFTEWFAHATTWMSDEHTQTIAVSRWSKFGARFGRQLHELGLTLGLRDDELGEYHDESNYSYINVTQQTEHGERVAILKLDKLIHSYYVIDQPNKLNYDYEKVYAAITEQAVATWDRTTTVGFDDVRRELEQHRQAKNAARPSVSLKKGRRDGLDALDEAASKVLDAKDEILFQVGDDPSDNKDQVGNSSPTDRPEKDTGPISLAEICANLPSWVTFDADKKTLSLRGGMTQDLRAELLRQHPYSSYWQAVERLGEMTRHSDWGDFGSVPLAALPHGIVIPEGLSQKLIYDRHLQALNVYRPLSADDVQTLLRLGDLDAVTYYESVDRLSRRSRRIGTMFVGGGGFVFPRWIESLFPDEPLIHVAELDPAVKTAVQARMGLPPDDQTHVQTTIGDARNFVDDRVRANAAAVKRGEQPVLYDFIYGDAFNDFSVPWHLTTKEFSTKVALLLEPKEGIYLVNLIDIYPRTEFPADIKNPDGTYLQIQGDIPEVLTRNLVEANEWTGAPTPFEGIEVLHTPDYSGYRLAVRGVMTEPLRDRLLKLAKDRPGFSKAVETLFAKSRKQRTGRFLGSYVKTIASVFPHVYVFSSEIALPSASRDTFVIVASKRKLDLTNLRQASDHWSGTPFASLETDAKGDRQARGQMGEILANAYGLFLTDNFAPVDNLLGAVFDQR